MIATQKFPKTKNELITALQKNHITKVSLFEPVTRKDMQRLQTGIKSFFGSDDEIAVILVKTK